MDPTTTFANLVAAVRADDAETATDCVMVLIAWTERGGFLPRQVAKRGQSRSEFLADLREMLTEARQVESKNYGNAHEANVADARAFKRALANDDAREMREVLSRMRARGFSQADFHGLFPSRALRDAVRAISAGGAR